MLKSTQGDEEMIRIYLPKLLGERKMTQADLARKTGIRPSTINEIYHGVIVRINLDHLDQICEALNCKLSDLIDYIPKNKRNNKPKND